MEKIVKWALYLFTDEAVGRSVVSTIILSFCVGETLRVFLYKWMKNGDKNYNHFLKEGMNGLGAFFGLMWYVPILQLTSMHNNTELTFYSCIFGVVYFIGHVILIRYIGSKYDPINIIKRRNKK